MNKALKGTRWANLFQNGERILQDYAKNVAAECQPQRSSARFKELCETERLGDVIDRLEQQNEGQDVNWFLTYSSLLRRCANEKALADGKRLHAHILKTGSGNDEVLGELLLQMYGKCGCLDNARAVFDKLTRRNWYSWNLMIAAYVRHGRGRDALDLYHKMNFEPNRFTVANILGACTSIGAIAEGKEIHALIRERAELQADVFTQNVLIGMYGKCGILEEARNVFDKMQERDVVSWNSMLAAYVQQGDGNEALALYDRMDTEGIRKNSITFSSAVAACSCLAAAGLDAGKRVHSQVVASGVEPDVILSTAFISMYSSCGSLKDAKLVFEAMRRRNLITWSVMITAFSQHGHDKDAVHHYIRMDEEGVQPNNYIVSTVLTACCRLGNLGLGILIYRETRESGVPLNLVVQNVALSIYAKSGELTEAKNLFDTMSDKSVVTWNLMVAAYVQYGDSKQALEIYHVMDSEPNAYMFATVLAACSNTGDLDLGKKIHARISAAKDFQSDSILQNALINMYAKCGDLVSAKKLFEEMPKKFHDEVTWNSLFTAYVQHGKPKEALELYHEMVTSGSKPTNVTFSCILNACSVLGDFRTGKEIHVQVIADGLESDSVVGTALMDMYAKCGNFFKAIRVFERIKNRSVYSWNAMIASYARHGYGEEANNVYLNMYLEGVQPDKVTFVSILDAFSHAGLLKEGRDCFVTMQPDHGIVPGVDHYICLIDLLSRSGRLEDAKGLVKFMPFEPDATAWMALLGGCKIHSNFEHGAQAALCVVQLEKEDPAAYVLLSSLYAGGERTAKNEVHHNVADDA